MKTFTVATYGYSQCPEFPTLEAARAFLKEIVADSLATARRRGHKQARKHKVGTDCYRITLGPDAQSTLYAHHTIVCF